MWLLNSETFCCEKIQCSIPSFSTSTSCKITCDSETGLHHGIINYDSSSISIVKQAYTNNACTGYHYIPFPTTTNTSIASIVVPVVTVTILLCISIATGGALLCACMKKRKQDLATLHSDSKDQQKYNA